MMNEPKFDLATAQLETINANDISEIFQFEDDGLDTPDMLDIVTQIEKENAQLVPKTNQNLAGPSTPKTINVSNVNNFQWRGNLPAGVQRIYKRFSKFTYVDVWGKVCSLRVRGLSRRTH